MSHSRMARALTAGLVLAGSALAALLPAGPAQAAGPPSTQYVLAFDDEFNDTAVDTSRWNYRTDVKAMSAQRPENVSEGGGYLSIAQKQESYAGMSYTGGGVVSKQRFRYGYYETRARINAGPGWHNSFWLTCGDGSTTFAACQRTEIDGFEIDSARPTTIHSGLWTWRGSGVKGDYSGGRTYDSGLDLTQWHTYGIDWEETAITYYVDGALTLTVPYPPSAWTHDPTNIWLTSILTTTPDTTKLPSALQFDYVRYYQKDAYVDNDGPASGGYTEQGTWLDSALTGWTYGSPTRYADCGSAGHTATWRPSLQATGTYQVYVWKVVYGNSDPAARYTTTYSGGTSTTYLNGTAGTSGWVSLGTFSFASGTTGSVTLTASGQGCARADAVKFVRS